MCRACKTRPPYGHWMEAHYVKDIKTACREGMKKGPHYWQRKRDRNEDIRRLLRTPGYVPPK